MKTVEDTVRRIMLQQPITRDSNDDLIIAVYKEYGVDLNAVQISRMKSAPSFETITRVRRKIQAAGVLQASPEVQRHRKDREKIFIDYSKIKYNDPMLKGGEIK